MINIASNLDILIVEDSMSYALELEMLCNEIGFNVISIEEDSGGALDVIFSAEPDLILMDVDIKGRLSGLEIGAKIEHLNIPVLYISSYTDRASHQRAEETNIVGFLQKPVAPHTIKATLEKIITERFKASEEGSFKFLKKSINNPSMIFFERGIYRKINLKDILYVESQDNYCLFYLRQNTTQLMRVTISSVEKTTMDNDFLRCHRSYIVNKKMIRGIDTQKNKITVGENSIIPFSRRKKDEVQAIILNY